MSAELARQVPVDRAAEALVGAIYAHAAGPGQPESSGSSVFGLFGPRGSGKSTVISQAAVKLAHGRAGGQLWLLDMIDCSLLPEDGDPGAALLVRLVSDDVLRQRMAAADRTLEARLRDLLGRQAMSEPGYRELLLELASRPDDYQRLVSDILRSRFLFRADFGRWLEDACRALRVDSLVVFLDDFDLTQGRMVRRWLRALLDELAQRRLIVVIAADLRRLEHLSFQPDEGVDDRTGRSQLDKVVPIGRRIELEGIAAGWEMFVPLGSPHHTPTLGTLFRAWLAQGDGRAYREAEHQLAALMPVRPRGQLAVYEALTRLSKVSSADPSDLDAHPHLDRDFLSVLARARGEHLLARRLEDEHVDDIADGLVWPDGSVEVETWRAMQDRARDTTTRRPLRGLAAPSKDGEAIPDPQSPDPARRERYWRDQLRDAEGENRDSWVELLLDLAGARRADARRALMLRWPPARERLATCSISVSIERFDIERFLTTGGDVRSLLPWITVRPLPPPRQPFALEIGWTPLFQALRRARDPWPADLLDRLNVGRGQIGGSEMDERQRRDDLGFLRLPTRELLLLIDALARCPWRALSTDVPSWRLSTHLRLASALCEAAFAFAALYQRFGDEVSSRIGARSGAASRQFLLQLHVRAPLIPQQESDVIDQLDQMEEDPLLRLVEELLDGERPLLHDAHVRFRSLRAVKALRLLGPPWP